MAMDSHGLPRRIIITEGSRNDSTQADKLTQGINVQNLIADKAYDKNSIIEASEESSTNPVIPSKSNRKIKRDTDEYLYTYSFIAALQNQNNHNVASNLALGHLNASLDYSNHCNHIDLTPPGETKIPFCFNLLETQS